MPSQGSFSLENARPVYESVDHEVLIVARMAGNSLHQLRVSITPLSTEFGHAHPSARFKNDTR